MGCALECGVASVDNVEVGVNICATTILAPAPEQGALEGAIVQQAVLQRVINGRIGDVLPLALAELQPKGKSQSQKLGDDMINVQ